MQGEYQKGEGSGIYLALNFPELLIEAYEAEITRKKFENNEEEA